MCAAMFIAIALLPWCPGPDQNKLLFLESAGHAIEIHKAAGESSQRLVSPMFPGRLELSVAS